MLLRAPGFRQLTNGVMRPLTDQLDSHMEKISKRRDIPIHWPSLGGGIDSAKLDYIRKKYAKRYTGKGDHLITRELVVIQ